MKAFLVLLVAGVMGSTSGPQQSAWTEDYAIAKEVATCEGRPMVVVLENSGKAAERAGAIFHVDSDVLTKFELCRVDVASDYGKLVAEKFSRNGQTVPQLPYTVITDASCKRIVDRVPGEKTVGEWMFTLNGHLEEDTDADQVARSDIGKPTVAQPKQSSDQPIFRYGSIEQAKTAAAKDGQPVLVYVSMDNCKFCDKMIAETFSDGSVRQSLQSSFHTVMVKKEQAAAFVGEHGITIYPTTIVISADGQSVTKIDGFVPPTEFLNLAKINAN